MRAMTRLPVGEPDQTTRGLDRLRQAGWRGTGRVPWSSEGNRGLIRSLSGLAQAAATIAEADEAARCRQFLSDLAPDAP
jgi:hypothetical protein